MSVFARPPDVITRRAVAVMLDTCGYEPSAIQQLWPRFEVLVGQRVRMFAVVDVSQRTYAACCPIGPDDDAPAIGLAVGELPGGRFRRGRLRGEPPEVYDLISAAVRELESAGPVDRRRPVVEFYKRDQIELWVPVPD